MDPLPANPAKKQKQKVSTSYSPIVTYSSLRFLHCDKTFALGCPRAIFTFLRLFQFLISFLSKSRAILALSQPFSRFCPITCLVLSQLIQPTEPTPFSQHPSHFFPRESTVGGVDWDITGIVEIDLIQKTANAFAAAPQPH